MAFYIDGVEKTLNERLDAFGRDLNEIKEAQKSLRHLVISSFIGPIVIAIVAAFLMKWVGHA